MELEVFEEYARMKIEIINLKSDNESLRTTLEFRDKTIEEMYSADDIKSKIYLSYSGDTVYVREEHQSFFVEEFFK